MKNFLLLLLLAYGNGLLAQPVMDSASRVQVAPKSSKNQAWVKAAAAAAYGGLIYTTYKFWDHDIQQFSQRNKEGVPETISRGVSDFGLGKFQTISLVSTSVVAFVSGRERLKKTVL